MAGKYTVVDNVHSKLMIRFEFLPDIKLSHSEFAEIVSGFAACFVPKIQIIYHQTSKLEKIIRGEG